MRNAYYSTDELVSLISQACREGYLDTIKYILSRTDIPLAQYSFLALSNAVVRNQVQVVKLLLDDHRIDASEGNCQVVRQAARYGYEAIVRLLLENGNVVDNSGHQAAFDGVVEFGGFALFQELVSLDSVDPSANDNFAIRSAASRNDSRMISRLLQDSRVDPSAKNNAALVKAARFGFQAAVDALVADPRIYKNGRIPLVPEQHTVHSYYNDSMHASRMIRGSVLQVISDGELPFDAAETLSTQTLVESDVQSASVACHNKSFLVAREAIHSLHSHLPDDVIVEVLWMIHCFSIFPWMQAKERKAELKHLVNGKLSA